MSLVTVYQSSKSIDEVIDTVARDKSISHRSVMFSMLASGQTKITNFLRAEDTLNSLKIIENLGAKVDDDGEIILIESDGIKESEEILDCGNSGTGMRLFCGLLSSANGHFILTGDEYLKRRPMKRVTQPLKTIGAKLDGRDNGNLAPLSIRGGTLKSFVYDSKIASAQVKSAMILAALSGDEESIYSEPELSRDHTERMLSAMGASIYTDDEQKIHIKPMQGLLKPLEINVPADPSSGFFFAVAAAITPNSKIILKDLTLNKTRIEAFKVLEKMGTKITYKETQNIYEPIGDIIVEYSPLKAVEVSENIAWLIDEIPALSIAFAFADGESIIKNAEELRVKESDRIATTVNNLNLCGVQTKEFDDGFSVIGTSKLQKAHINSYGDHRIAMSFAIAGLNCGMEIEDIDCINTSFPNFFEILQKFTRVEFEN